MKVCFLLTIGILRRSMGHPKPTALRIKQGNLSNRPLNRNEPQPEIAIPLMPDFVKNCEYAKREWEYITPKLYELGILSVIDRAAIAAYCMAYARWAQAEEKSAGQSMVVRSTKGSPMMNPLVRAARDAMEQMSHIVTEFGMTPASRTRLRVDSNGILRFDDERTRYFA